LILFINIAVSNGGTYMPLKEMNLTTKMFRSRVSRLLNAGLIKRNKGKYSITLLGKVVYESQMIICKALGYYWKLRAIESIEMSTAFSGCKVQEQEVMSLVYTLIDNHEIRDIVTDSFNLGQSSPSIISQPQFSQK
jgi:hypothetical protein